MAMMIDGPMIERFIENTQEFNKYVEETLNMINNNQKKTEKLTSISLDHQDGEEEEEEEEEGNDGFSTVDLEGFREYYMAVAQGIGNTPVNILVEEGSFMKKVYEFEVLRIEIREIEERKKNKIITKEIKLFGDLLNHVDINAKNDDKVDDDVVVHKKKSLRKKTSLRFLRFLRFCACSSKPQFVQD